MQRLIRPLALAALGVVLAGPASAQNLRDVGRALQDQVLGTPPDPQADRNAYEQGRRDEAIRRDEGRRAYDDRRHYDEDQRHRADDAERRRRDMDRQHADQQRAWADEQRARDQSYRR